MTDLKTLAVEALAWIKSQGGSVEAEVYLARGEERSIELREGKLDGFQEASSAGAGLRLARDGRMGFGSAGGLSLDTIQDLYAKVLTQLDHIETDKHKRLSAPPSSAPDAALAESLWDSALFSEPLSGLLPRLEEMSAQALSADARVTSVLRVGYGESRGDVAVASTVGGVCVERAASASVGLSALAGDGAEVKVGSAFQSTRRAKTLDFKRVAADGAFRAVSMLGAKKLPSGRRAVVFDPWVAGEFLELIESLLCADQVQRGKSLLAGKLGRTVGSELVSFVDDPRMKGGLGSSLYDDEGWPTRRKVMIEKGVVKEYFYDVYTAAKEGRENNASAGRASYKGVPSPSASNFYLAPGSISRDALMAGTADGILVMDIMGMHTADPISGEFSVGVSGLRIESGRLTHPVREAMIAGNILDLLGRVDAVADDLTFYGSAGAPTFRIAHMTVA